MFDQVEITPTRHKDQGFDGKPPVYTDAYRLTFSRSKHGNVKHPMVVTNEVMERLASVNKATLDSPKGPETQ